MSCAVLEQWYKGKDNATDLLIKANNVPEDLTGVTRYILTLRYSEDIYVIDSDDEPNVFSGSSEGVLTITPQEYSGFDTMINGSYWIRLELFDATNVNGIVHHSYDGIIIRVSD